MLLLLLAVSVSVRKIEDRTPGTGVGLRRMVRVHLRHQPPEVRGTPWIDQDQFAVEHHRARGQLGEGAAHLRQPFRVLGTVARVKADCVTVLANLKSAAVPFAARATRHRLCRAVSKGRVAGSNKRKDEWTHPAISGAPARRPVQSASPASAVAASRRSRSAPSSIAFAPVSRLVAMRRISSLLSAHSTQVVTASLTTSANGTVNPWTSTLGKQT